MGFKDITAGDKIAKAKGARFIKSPKKGTLGIEVSFEFTEASTDMPERLNWVAWLSPKAIENSMETLYNVLGFNGSEKTDENGVLTDPDALDYDREVKLVVELEERKDDEGNTKADKDGFPILDPRIKWVNSLGGSGFASVAVETVKADLKAIGFKAAFLNAQKKNPKLKKKETASAPKPPAFDSDEELPY